MRTTIEDLAEEADRLIRDRTWVVSPAERHIADKAAADLLAAIADPQNQQRLPAVRRLERLREAIEAIAAVAIALAHVHGRLAWFLGAAATALTPILHWRALPADDSSTFGAVAPSFQQYMDAEESVCQLQVALARIAVA
ncbi:hypothetical protein DWB77_07491 [Streptomyces hundungensis]|uniref:Uncharacterized protein n=1 Tax=Streptomyces hundungensis TaxID=1077946 RepID=A0A387HNX4_9ACTN|nr:hypothetical protein [Streptomyces hundungensis]AYG85274.1 hypothetical protein DWB77_07491 [Streptomyces hundungensis]